MPSFKAPVRDGIAADAGERQRDRGQRRDEALRRVW